jgi:hypothetical protein
MMAAPPQTLPKRPPLLQNPGAMAYTSGRTDPHARSIFSHARIDDNGANIDDSAASFDDKESPMIFKNKYATLPRGTPAYNIGGKHPCFDVGCHLAHTLCNIDACVTTDECACP